MFSVVKVQSGLVMGDVVAFDPNQGVFALSSSLSTPLGVLSEDAREAYDFNVETQTLEPLGYYIAPVSFAGIAFAKCSRDIPDEGGELMVEGGQVYVDNEANGAGIICPLPHDQSTRTAGSLVMVHIR